MELVLLIYFLTLLIGAEGLKGHFCLKYNNWPFGIFSVPDSVCSMSFCGSSNHINYIHFQETCFKKGHGWYDELLGQIQKETSYKI